MHDALSSDARTRAGAPTPTGLLKILGFAFGLAVLVGNTIGMGILRTPGEVAAALPSVPLFMSVWVAGAAYALLGALCVAEMGARYPRSGGLYPLVHDQLGAYPGFLVGWTDWLGTCGSTAAVALVLSEYLSPLAPWLGDQPSRIAMVVVIGFAILQWRGIRVGDATQRLTSLLKALALVALVVLALFVTPSAEASGATTHPAANLPGGIALLTAVIVGMQSVIFTYDGWTGPVYFGEEIVDAEREIPRSMIGGILVVLIIYLGLNFAFLRVVPIAEMAGDPFVAATVAKRLFGPTGDTVLRVVMLISLLASVNALQLMASRVPFAMSRDRLLPKLFQQVNPGGTPQAALIAGTCLALLFIATNTIDSALALLAFFFVANYTLTFIAFFRQRRRDPIGKRPFRTPWYPIVPAVALIGSVAFLISAVWSDTHNSLYALGLVVLSGPAFWLMRRTTAGTPTQR